MFDTGLLRRLRYLSLLADRAGGRSLAAAPAPSGEVADLRDYCPGDDYRRVDWALCARRDELLTRTAEVEEDLYVYVLVDCSPSMGLGRPPKFDLARHIAAALGYAALLNLACLGVMGFSGGIVAADLPMRGSSRIPRLLDLLNRLKLQGTRTDLARTAEGLVRRCRRPGPVVILSDLYDPNGIERGLNLLQGHGYRPRVVQVYDPAEADPAALGDLELVDVESGAASRVTVTERDVRRYGELYARFHKSVRRHCAQHGIACIQIAGNTPVDEALLSVLGGKAHTTAGAMGSRT